MDIVLINPNSERIEILTTTQFQQLLEVWQLYPERQLSHLHQFIGWTGSRASKAPKQRHSSFNSNS